jgi:predicted Zn-dependent protease
VIAHEIAHAKLGHPTEAYFRRGLISAVTDAIFGGGFGTGGMESVASLAITLGYSREAETQADELAIEALNDAGITTEGMANFFSRSAPNSQGALDLLNKIDWLSTHPSDTERRQRALEQGTGRNQALSPEDWRALKGICG